MYTVPAVADKIEPIQVRLPPMTLGAGKEQRLAVDGGWADTEVGTAPKVVAATMVKYRDTRKHLWIRHDGGDPERLDA